MPYRSPSTGVRWASIALGLLACAASACDSPSKPADTPSTQGASASAASATASAASAASADGLSPMLRAQWSALMGRPPPQTMANADERRFYQKCLAFTRALHRQAGRLDDEGQLGAVAAGSPDSLLLAVEAVRQQPPKMPAADLEWCVQYTVKSLRSQLGAMRAEQVQSTLQAMGGAMAAAFDRDGKLCPSTTEPVPPKPEQVSTAPYQPAMGDWDGPAWRCLRFRWLRPLRFQYELRTTKDGFAFLARGRATDEATVDEYRLAGTVQNGSIELGSVTGRFLAGPTGALPTASTTATPSAAP